MSEWKEYILEDVIDKFIDYRGKTPRKTASGIPLMTAKIVKSGRLLNATEFIALEDYETWMSRGFPEVDDVLLTTEAPLGEVALIKDKNVALGQRLITLQTKKDVCNSVFLKYYIQSNEGQSILQARASGSTVEGIKAAELKKIVISLPTLPTQRSIANILSSLDNKIDLLHRQNATLEKMAETLFQHWFFDEAKEERDYQIALCDVIESVSVTHKFPNQSVVFLNTSDVLLGNVLEHNPTSVKDLPGQAKKSILKNDILYSEIRPANGRWAYIDFNADNYVVSTKLMVLRSKNIISQAFIYFYLTNPNVVASLQMLAESRSGTFPQITFDHIKDLKINVPPGKILNTVETWCDDTLRKIKSNHNQIRTLTSLRDTLLPKLMSGEVKVLGNEN